MLELVDISKAFGSQRLFEHVNLRVGDRDRVGLVGPNGTGKTTLFRIMLNEMSPDTGRVEIKKGLRIGYLPQEVSPSLAREQPLLDFCIREARGVGRLLDARVECLHDLDHGPASGHEAAAHRLAEVEEALRHADAESLPKEAESVLLGIGFERGDLVRPLRQL